MGERGQMERRGRYSPVASISLNPHGKALTCLSILVTLRLCFPLFTVDLAIRISTAKDALARKAVIRGSIDTIHHLNKL